MTYDDEDDVEDDNQEEGDDQEEEGDEPEKSCTFQTDYKDEDWMCDLADNTVCNTAKCPFWTEK